MIRMPPHRGGWLEVVCGPMYSGKSEELIRRLRRAEIAGQKVLVVKAGFDDRYDVAHVVSHAGDRIRAVCAEADDVLRLAEGYEVIGLDELHFFDEAVIVDAVLELRERGRRVVVSGLDCDFRGEPFPAMARLLCHAELVDKLQAVCHRCGGPATLFPPFRSKRPSWHGQRITPSLTSGITAHDRCVHFWLYARN